MDGYLADRNERGGPIGSKIRNRSRARNPSRREKKEKEEEEEKRIDQRSIYRDRGWLCGVGRENGSAESIPRARSVVWRGTVTHSPINFASRSIDHNVLFCSLVFLSAAFDSIRGCGESIYLPRCHAPPVMDGGCTLTLATPKESLCQEPTHYYSPSLPTTRLRFRS